jgi:K+-sensing histidine kinase KdpD
MSDLGRLRRIKFRKGGNRSGPCEPSDVPMHRCPDPFPNPALDFSHSSSAFCHLSQAEKFDHMDMDEEIKKTPPSAIVDALVGAFLAAIAAAGTSMIASGHKWEVFVPLAFVVILLVISAFFGARAGVLATIVAALIFAAFLFRPLGKLLVTSDDARANLAWMLLLGISFSFLFAPQHSGFRRH